MQTDSKKRSLFFSEPVWTEMFNILSNSHFLRISNRNKNIMIDTNSIYRLRFIFQNINMCKKQNSNLLHTFKLFQSHVTENYSFPKNYRLPLPISAMVLKFDLNWFKVGKHSRYYGKPFQNLGLSIWTVDQRHLVLQHTRCKCEPRRVKCSCTA